MMPSSLSTTRRARLDLRDAFVAGGYAVFVGGVACLSVAWACIIGGGLLCLFGLVASVRSAPAATTLPGDAHGNRQ